jgi:transcriptional regulator with XRE-family HTH domain
MSKYARLFERAVQSVDYWTQVSIRDFITDLSARMEQRGINRAKLASEINVSPAYVTKALRGNANFTLETMNKFAMVVGGRVKVSIVDQAKPIADAIPVSSGLYLQTRRIDHSESTSVEISNRADAANEWDMGVRFVRNSATLLRKAA